MSELGFGAGGVAEALQLMQSLQGNKVDLQQKQVALESSQIQLENMKKLQATLGGQSFASAMQGGAPEDQSKALTNLANVYLASNMPQQAKSVMDMATNMASTRAYVTEQQAAASQKYITMAEDLFSGVSNAQEWSAAQQFMQSQLPPEAMNNPTVKGLLTGAYSPDKVRILPQFFERLKQRAQIVADQARASMEDAHTRYYQFEEKRDMALTDEYEARADALRKAGASSLLPNKEEISAVASDLQARFPEEEAQPVVMGGKLTDPTAMRSNYKARIQARAVDIAEAAKAYTRQGMTPAEARRKAIEEAETRGELSTLKPAPGTRPGGTVPPPQTTSAGLEAWGEPKVGGK